MAHIPGKRGYSGADELKVDPAIIVQTTQALEGFSGTPESALTRPDVAGPVPVTHKIHTLRQWPEPGFWIHGELQPFHMILQASESLPAPGFTLTHDHKIVHVPNIELYAQSVFGVMVQGIKIKVGQPLTGKCSDGQSPPLIATAMDQGVKKPEQILIGKNALYALHEQVVRQAWEKGLNVGLDDIGMLPLTAGRTQKRTQTITGGMGSPPLDTGEGVNNKAPLQHGGHVQHDGLMHHAILKGGSLDKPKFGIGYPKFAERLGLPSALLKLLLQRKEIGLKIRVKREGVRIEALALTHQGERGGQIAKGGNLAP